jgi:hypothetical protein
MLNRIKKSLPIIWLIILYAGTILTAGESNAPAEGTSERVAFEWLHAAVHFSVFAVMFWLMAYAASSAWLRGKLKTVLLIISLALVIGLGQEWIQAYIRQKIYGLNSLWDIGMDVLGAIFGWWLVARRGNPAGSTTRVIGESVTRSPTRNEPDTPDKVALPSIQYQPPTSPNQRDLHPDQ